MMTLLSGIVPSFRIRMPLTLMDSPLDRNSNLRNNLSVWPAFRMSGVRSSLNIRRLLWEVDTTTVTVAVAERPVSSVAVMVNG